MTIGLVVLVRDEADQIAEFAAAVKPHIAAWTIIDTGSTDGTSEAVEKAFADIPGVLHRREWVSFAHNRTEALELAKGTADYLLMLDADHRLHAEGPMPNLTDDSYLIKIGGDFEWRLPLLVKGDLDWRYEGAAHAYLTGGDGRTQGDLDALWIESPRKESPRSDKIERDALLLEADIDPRTVFYLAQTYRDLGHKREAADLYRLRVRISAANQQDVFWACYQEGLLRLEIDGLAAAVPVLLEAWQRRPTRSESLWKLAREYRLSGQPDLALLFANQAVAVPDTTDNGFVLRWIYRWGARMERALAAEATGDTETAAADFQLLHELELPGGTGAFMAAQNTRLNSVERIAA